MVNCCINGCKSRSERNQPDITFHRFPKEACLRNKWIECTSRVNWLPSRHSRICSRHFEASCIQKKLNKTHLDPHSIPTLFLEVEKVIDPPSSSKFGTLTVDTEAKNSKLEGLLPTTDCHDHLPSEEVAMEIEVESTMNQEILPMVAAPEVEKTPRERKLNSKSKKKTILNDSKEPKRNKKATSRSKTHCVKKLYISILTLPKPDIAIDKTLEKVD